jgi:hypothetical protein
MVAQKKKSAVDAFIALPDAEKDRIASRFNRKFSKSETEPLSESEKREWSQLVRRAA